LTAAQKFVEDTYSRPRRNVPQCQRLERQAQGEVIIPDWHRTAPPFHGAQEAVWITALVLGNWFAGIWSALATSAIEEAARRPQSFIAQVMKAAAKANGGPLTPAQLRGDGRSSGAGS
jgi:hypothetical protein